MDVPEITLVLIMSRLDPEKFQNFQFFSLNLPILTENHKNDI